ETEARLRRYGALLCAMNERVRLVGPRDETTLWNEHIVDCLNVLPLLPESGAVVDVGTGGGLPGAVLAICRPSQEFTLLDSLSRKTNALSAIVDELGLDNARVVCSRSEDLASGSRESFSCAVVRAVSEAGIIAEYLSPLVAPGGKLIAMKGSSVGDELAPLEGRWGELGLKDPVTYEYEQNGHAAYMLVWEKAAPCPEKYPRRPGRAEKKLWWR
ncbi:MAG: 16S rRNA (guanine(527)-N(7))-methyltransferase RsmG, partial [Pyramidobacter sp.]|nr:16S rRNA (guanine(527)-N(7))-methyltransferase RsmG [Pyramidobacter sp.]